MAMMAVRAAINARQDQENKERQNMEKKKKIANLSGHLDEMTRTQLIADLRETEEMKYIALIALGKRACDNPLGAAGSQCTGAFLLDYPPPPPPFFVVTGIFFETL